MDEKGIEYLSRKLVQKRSRVLTRYEYYEMKDSQIDKGITIPTELKWLYRATLGWCAKTVDSMADRLVFRGFREKSDIFQLNEIFRLNNADILFDSAILGALISSCDFIDISEDENGYPRLEVIDGGNATGILDPFTGLLREGYAVLERDPDTKDPIVEAYYLPGEKQIYRKGDKDVETLWNDAPAPLLVPVINRPDSVRPFGHSRISRACMYLQAYAKHTLERSEISAEFYSIPQRYVLGMDPEVDYDKWRATITSMFRVDRDDDGNVPQLGQFSQQSMQPFMDQLRTAASMFAGETGLTLDDLGFVSQNPSSAEAIKASHESLRLQARKAQRTFTTGFLNAGYLAACVRDQYEFHRDQFYTEIGEWEPVFEPDFAALSSIGDGVIKINQAVPGYVGNDSLRNLTGIDSDLGDDTF